MEQGITLEEATTRVAKEATTENLRMAARKIIGLVNGQGPITGPVRKDVAEILDDEELLEYRRQMGEDPEEDTDKNYVRDLVATFLEGQRKATGEEADLTEMVEYLTYKMGLKEWIGRRIKKKEEEKWGGKTCNLLEEKARDEEDQILLNGQGSRLIKSLFR